MTGSINGLGTSVPSEPLTKAQIKRRRKKEAEKQKREVASVEKNQTTPQIQKVEAQLPKVYPTPAASSSSSSVLPRSLEQRQLQLKDELEQAEKQKQSLYAQAQAMGLGDIFNSDLSRVFGSSLSRPSSSLSGRDLTPFNPAPSSSYVPPTPVAKVEQKVPFDPFFEKLQKDNEETARMIETSKNLIFRALLRNDGTTPQEKAELNAMARAPKLSEAQYDRVAQIQEAVNKRKQDAELAFVERRMKDLTPQEYLALQSILRRRDNLGESDRNQIVDMKMRLLKEDLATKALGEVNEYLGALKEKDDFMVKMEVVEAAQAKEFTALTVAQKTSNALVVQQQMVQAYESNKLELTPYLFLSAAQKKHMEGRLRLLKGTRAEARVSECISRLDEMAGKIKIKIHTHPLLLKTDTALLALPAPKSESLAPAFSSLSLTSAAPTSSSLSSPFEDRHTKLFEEFVNKKTLWTRKLELCDQVAKEIENFSINQFRQICSVLMMLKKDDLLKSLLARFNPIDVRYKHIDQYLTAIGKVTLTKQSSLYSIFIVNLDKPAARSTYDLLQIAFLARDLDAIKEHISELISIGKFDWKTILCLLSDNQDETSVIKAVARATKGKVEFDEEVAANLKDEIADTFPHLKKEEEEVDFVCQTLDRVRELLGQFSEGFDLGDSKT